MKVKYGLFGAGALIGLALMLVGWQFISGPYKYQGSLIDPPVPAANFTLTDQNGKPFTLSEQSGKVVLIFFGYTNCTDVCPLTLSEFKQVKEKLGDQAQKVEFVFITVDPERDTAERLGKYLSNFDPTFVGLTGTPAELQSVWKAYGVYVAKKDTGSAAGYEVQHTSLIYAIDAKGNWRLTYPLGMETSKLVQDVEHLIRAQ